MSAVVYTLVVETTTTIYNSLIVYVNTVNSYVCGSK